MTCICFGPMALTRGLLVAAVVLGGCGPSAGSGEAGAGASGEGLEQAAGAETRGEQGPAGVSQERLPLPGRAWVIFGSDTVRAEVARTAEERAQGLMYRSELPEGTGMLFLFPDARIRSFWMQNTMIPLDIAYLDENLRIVDIQAMEPESEAPHESAGPAMFALEVPQGWFEKKGIGVGDEARLVFGPGG